MNTLPAQLILPFLEKREYLHGTTLFDALRSFVPSHAKLSYTFSHLIRSNRVEVVQLDNADATKKTVSVTLAATTDSFVRILGVVPLPASQDLQRLSYNENLVTDSAKFSDAQVAFDACWPFSFVATIVPLHKALLSRVVKPVVAGQWFFTRLDIVFVPEEPASVVLKVDSVLGNKIAKTSIHVAGEHIGHIYFSWVKKN